MGISCDLFARRKNEKTGEYSQESSQLHKDLTDINKVNQSFTRKQANDALFLSQSKKFRDKFKDTLIFDSDTATREPLLASFYEIARMTMPQVTFEDIRTLLADKYKEGVYDYETALQKAIEFNKNGYGGHAFIGIVEMASDGKFQFRVAFNTEAETKTLIDTIQKINFAREVSEMLEKHKVKITTGKESKYTNDPSTLTNGYYGFIQLCEGKQGLDDLYNETGHFIVDALGRMDPLVSKIFNAIRQDKKIAHALVDTHSINKDENFDLEVVGHLVGQALKTQHYNSKNPVLGHFKTLIRRCIDKLKTLIPSTRRSYYKRLYASKKAAYNIAKSFLKDNFKGSLENVLGIPTHTLHSKKRLRESMEMFKDQINKVRLIVAQLSTTHTNTHEMRELLKDKTKAFYRLGKEQAGVTEADAEAFDNKVVQEYSELLQLISTEYAVSVSDMFKILEGDDINMTNSQMADIIKKFDYLKDFIDNVIKKWNTEFKDRLSGEAFDKINDAIQILTALDRGIEDKGSQLYYQRFTASSLLGECRKKVGLNLLVEINGSQFIAFEQHIRMENGRIIQEEETSHDLLEELNKYSGRYTPTWLTNYIDAMADNPDILNQMVANVVEEKKFIAQNRTLEFRDRMLDWNKRFQTGIHKYIPGLQRSHKILFERDSLGHISGNIISKRWWGEWERKLKEDQRKFKKTYYEDNQDKYESMSEMYYDPDYIASFDKFMKDWHKENSSRIPVRNSQGDILTDDEDNELTRWAPAIRSDSQLDETGQYVDRYYNSDETITKRYYDSEQYKKLGEKYGEETLDLVEEWIMMKRELDMLLPNGAGNAFGVRLPQFRGLKMQRYKGSIREALTDAWNTATLGKVDPNDVEFGGQHNTYDYEDLLDEKGSPLYDQVVSNSIQAIGRVPLYGVRKLPNINTISPDLVYSTIKYSQMANNNNCLEEVVNQISVIADQTRGRQSEGKVWSRLTWLAGRKDLNVTQRLADYMNQQVFNQYSIGVGTEKQLKLRYRNLLKYMTGIASTLYLGWNVTSSVVNAGTGFWEILKEAGGEEFTHADVLAAEGVYLWYFLVGIGSNITHTLNNTKQIAAITKMHLLQRKFDFKNDTARELGEQHLQSLGYGLLQGKNYRNLAMIPFKMTEQWMQDLPFLASMFHTKVRNKKTGKVVNLWRLYKEKGDKLLVRDENDGWNGKEEDWEILEYQQERLNDLLHKEINEKNYRDEAQRKAKLASIFQSNDTYQGQDDNTYYDENIERGTTYGKEWNGKINGNYETFVEDNPDWVKEEYDGTTHVKGILHNGKWYLLPVDEDSWGSVFIEAFDASENKKIELERGSINMSNIQYMQESDWEQELWKSYGPRTSDTRQMITEDELKYYMEFRNVGGISIFKKTDIVDGDLVTSWWMRDPSGKTDRLYELVYVDDDGNEYALEDTYGDDEAFLQRWKLRTPEGGYVEPFEDYDLDYDFDPNARETIEGFKPYTVNGVFQYMKKSRYRTWDEKAQNKWKMRVRGINNRMHGVYNQNDGGAYLGSVLGAPFASLKKYAIGLIDNRFSRIKYDFRTGRMREGYWITFQKFLWDSFNVRGRMTIPNAQKVKNLRSKVKDDKSKWYNRFSSSMKLAKKHMDMYGLAAIANGDQLTSKKGLGGKIWGTAKGTAYTLSSIIEGVLEVATVLVNSAVAFDGACQTFGKSKYIRKAVNAFRSKDKQLTQEDFRSPITSMLINRKYSTNQIKNIGRWLRQQAIKLFIQWYLMDVLFAPPPEGEEQKAWWQEASEFLVATHIASFRAYKKLMNKIYDLTGGYFGNLTANDETLLGDVSEEKYSDMTPEELANLEKEARDHFKMTLLQSHRGTPEGIKEYCFYLSQRLLTEQKAYDYLNPLSMFSEYLHLSDNTLPFINGMVSLWGILKGAFGGRTYTKESLMERHKRPSDYAKLEERELFEKIKTSGLFKGMINWKYELYTALPFRIFNFMPNGRVQAESDSYWRNQGAIRDKE